VSPIVFDLFYGLVGVILGAAGAAWLFWSDPRRIGYTDRRGDTRYAEEVLVRLQELISRLAFNVDEHNSQVEEINDKLASIPRHELSVVIDAVAVLIAANEQMHQKLASTENKLREQAQELQVHAVEARTDALTLLGNRRAFDEELVRRFAEFSRHGRSFSLIMADVDHFKKFNDMYRHQAGDEALRALAKQLRRKLREMDVLTRYGGEEFAAILPGTNLQSACVVALRARDAVEKLRIRFEGSELQLTASFGVAEAQGCGDGMTLIDRADKALYAAKENGRNCVYSHDDEGVHRVLQDQRAVPCEAGGTIA